MRKREYEAMVKRAALAYKLDSPDFDSIMDNASNAVETMEEWDKFMADFDESISIPLTERQRRAYMREIKGDAT